MNYSTFGHRAEGTIKEEASAVGSPSWRLRGSTREEGESVAKGKHQGDEREGAVNINTEAMGE